MSLLPAVQLLAPSIRQSDNRGPSVGGIWLPLGRAGFYKLLHQAARGRRSEVQLRTDFPDSDADGLVVAQALQQLDLRHRQGFPRVIGADTRAQHATQPVDHLCQRLGVGIRRARSRDSWPGCLHSVIVGTKGRLPKYSVTGISWKRDR
jgi:hypothetical protein